MNPFEGNAPWIDEKLTEIEPGVYVDHLKATELSNPELEDSEIPVLVFGSLEQREDSVELSGFTDDVLSCCFACSAVLTDRSVARQELADDLKENCLYDDRYGMSQKDVEGCFMHLSELEGGAAYVECGELSGLNELCICLDTEDIVICYISSAILENESFAAVPGINADRFVQVVGVDLSQETGRVLVYDGADPVNCSKIIPLDRFLKAWIPNGCYAITAKARDAYDD